MSRSHTGKIKLDIERLERRETKLLRRLDGLKKNIGQNRYILDALKKALIEKVTKETVASELAALGKEPETVKEA